jgi:hypothetical protein
MKEKDKKTLLVGAGAVALLGLAVYASRGSGRDEPLNLGGGGGGGGYSIPFVDADKGAEKTEGGGMTSYQIAFPDVTIPSLPQPPTWGFSGGETYTPTYTPAKSIPTEVTHSSGKKETINITAPPGGITPTTGRPAGPLSQEEKDFMGGGGGFGGGGATPGNVSGIPGGSSTKKGAAVGQETAPGGLPGLIGGLIGGIGGLFGW